MSRSHAANCVHPRYKCRARNPRFDHQSEDLQGLSDLVLYVEQFALERPPASRQKPYFVTFLTLDMNRSVPARPHQMRQTARVILVGLVELRLQGSRRLPCFQQDQGKAQGHELAVQPRCHTAGFTADHTDWLAARSRSTGAPIFIPPAVRP